MSTAINDTQTMSGGPGADERKVKQSKVLLPSSLVRIKKPSSRTEKPEIRGAHFKRHHLA